MGWLGGFPFLSSRHRSRTTDSDQYCFPRQHPIFPAAVRTNNAATTTTDEIGDDEATSKIREQGIVSPQLGDDFSDLGTPIPTSSSPESKQSGQWFKGFKEFMAMLFRRQREDPSRRPGINDIVSVDNPTVTVTGDCGANSTGTIQQTGREVFNNVEPRKVSDHSQRSSNQSTRTVFRRPSQHAYSSSFPFVNIDGNYMYYVPFDDSSTSRSQSKHYSTSTTTTTTTTTPPRSRGFSRGSLAFSEEDSEIVYDAEVVRSSESGRQGNLQTESRAVSQEGSFKSIPSRDSGSLSGPLDRKRACQEFYKMAETLGLETPGSGDDDDDQGMPRIDNTNPEETPSRREKLLSKIRRMRSNMSIRSRRGPSERTLRRTKTFGSLSMSSCQAQPMTSLNGRSLEDLARLGGHSFLSLPADFAPTTLRLPACLVATATYLRCNAPSTRGVFAEEGCMSTAKAVYDYFAEQVLSAEREKDSRIQMTMRRASMPFELGRQKAGNVEDKGRYSEARQGQVQAVGTVFQWLLGGLPGGILGSGTLYRALVGISKRRFSRTEFAENGRSYLQGVTQAEFKRVQAMALAILGLTSEMHVELICAVFGVCRVMMYETERRIRMGKRGFLNEKRLVRWVGRVLTDSSSSSSSSSSEDSEMEQVTWMLMANWQDISRLLRIWERRGYPPRREAIPWTGCEDEEFEDNEVSA